MDLLRSWFRRSASRCAAGVRRRPLLRHIPRLDALERRDLPSAGIIRIVTYNIEADIDGVTTPRAGLYQVLEGIGEEQVQGHVQPPDIITLEETTSNSTTVAPIVSALNSYYNGAAVYAQSSYQATEADGDAGDGNGPNALVYNTSTLTLLASVGVGTPEGSSNGEYRQVVRYEFQAVGFSAGTGIFYVYVEHAKSGTTSADATDRNEEAQIVRNDEATLPAGARVLYTGDLNTTSSSDASYQTLTAATSPGGVAQGQGFDPIDMPGNWDLNAAFQGIMTESATDLRYRDDHEIVTQNIDTDAPGGLGYIAGSYHTFGNNGTTPEGGDVDSGSDTALNSDLVQDGGTFIPASTLYADLTTASDHLPVVADYVIVPQSTTTTLTSSANPSTLGQAVSFTVTVSGGTAITGETVQIEDADNGDAVVATPTLTNGTATFTLSNLSAGVNGASHHLFAVYAGDANDAASQSAQIDQVVYTPLAVAALVNGAAVTIAGQSVSLAGSQRSMVDNIVVTFSRPVTLDASALSLALHANVTVSGTAYADGYGTLPDTVSVTNPSGDGMTWVVSFSGASVIGQSIADGIYDITITGSAVHDTTLEETYAQEATAAGTAVNVTNTFYRLFGDINGDGIVNNADNAQLKKTYLASAGQSGYNAAFDYNADGVVNNADNLAFKQSYLVSYSGFTATI